MSKDKGKYDDYHDYSDAVEKCVYHWFDYTCKRCGKKFCI